MKLRKPLLLLLDLLFEKTVTQAKRSERTKLASRLIEYFLIPERIRVYFFPLLLSGSREGDLLRSKLKSPSFRSSLSGKALDEARYGSWI